MSPTQRSALALMLLLTSQLTTTADADYRSFVCDTGITLPTIHIQDITVRMRAYDLYAKHTPKRVYIKEPMWLGSYFLPAFTHLEFDKEGLVIGENFSEALCGGKPGQPFGNLIPSVVRTTMQFAGITIEPGALLFQDAAGSISSFVPAGTTQWRGLDAARGEILFGKDAHGNPYVSGLKIDRDQLYRGKRLQGSDHWVSFFPNGDLKAAILAENDSVSGVSLRKGTQYSLYDNMNLKRGVLGQPLNWHGATIPIGTVVHFDTDRQLEFTSGKGTVESDGLSFNAKLLHFYSNGQIASGTLASESNINGDIFPPFTYVGFDMRGRLVRATIDELKLRAAAPPISARVGSFQLPIEPPSTALVEFCRKNNLKPGAQLPGSSVPIVCP